MSFPPIRFATTDSLTDDDESAATRRPKKPDHTLAETLNYIIQ